MPAAVPGSTATEDLPREVLVAHGVPVVNVVVAEPAVRLSLRASKFGSWGLPLSTATDSGRLLKETAPSPCTCSTTPRLDCATGRRLQKRSAGWPAGGMNAGPQRGTLGEGTWDALRSTVVEKAGSYGA